MGTELIKGRIIYAGFGQCLARVELDLSVRQCMQVADILGPNSTQAEQLREMAARLDNHEVEQ